MRIFIIYVIINKINDKKYIGQTRKKLNERWNGTEKSFLRNYKQNPHLINSVKKYRIKNFKRKILDFAQNQEELDKKEEFYIQKYNTLDHNFGYNLKHGGLKGKHTQETAGKIGKASKARWEDPEMRKKMIKRMKGIKKSKEWREKKSKEKKENGHWCGENNPIYIPELRKKRDKNYKEWLEKHLQRLENDSEYKKKCYPKFYTIGEAIKIFDENGFILLEKEYKNMSTSMKYQCKKCGYLGKKQLIMTIKGQKCGSCGKRKKNTKYKYITRDFLIKEYWLSEYNMENGILDTKQKSTYQITKEFCFNSSSVQCWMKKYNILYRTKTESQKLRRMK